MQVNEKWKNAERAPDKRHVHALREAVEAGAVSWLMLQKKLHTSVQDAVALLKWLIKQGFVEGNGDLNVFHATKIPEAEFVEYCEAHKLSQSKKGRGSARVEDALYKASLRLFIKENTVNLYLLVNTFMINGVKARKVLDQMYEDRHIRLGDKGYELARTKEEYEAWFQENI